MRERNINLSFLFLIIWSTTEMDKKFLIKKEKHT